MSRFRQDSSRSCRQIKKIMPLVKKVESLRDEMQALSDDELCAKTEEFKKRIQEGPETTDDLLPEAYAAVREAARRSVGMEPFEVQVIGAIILHQGRIAEMKTGEGKTLVATMPAYLNALEGRGVQVVTVNDYLAKRDAEWMGKIYKFLGLSVGVVTESMNPQQRKAAYACDITYVTNNELGFDYLRDNMASKKEETVLRGLHFAIIDEVDSVLIDEARTPLIISGEGEKSTQLYKACDQIARQLRRGSDMGDLSKIDAVMGNSAGEDGDFSVNEKDHLIALTAQGIKKVEQFFHIENLAAPENREIRHGITMALRANNLMHKDKDYIVRDGQVQIVDEFTGRVMPDRRYSDGLHQALEAKEGVEVKKQSRTLATITFQSFFNKFEKKCGMTGTAKTEEKEFQEIYNMDVIEIPTNLPVIRKDLPDRVYKTKEDKYAAVVKDVENTHTTGQPILIGTASIEVSETISRLLSRNNISHQVLNAKHPEKEASIVANAGKHGAVTIATNMAGRGTDIKLDDEAKAAGGLKIIGTERHESRRIDNQLRGRSGRQGDPGESVFYISLEDDLLRLFGSDKIRRIFDSLEIPDGEMLKHKSLAKAVETAQKRIEGNNFGIRKNLLDFDSVVNFQREIIYNERRKILESPSVKLTIEELCESFTKKCVNSCISGSKLKRDGAEPLNEMISRIIPVTGIRTEECRIFKKKAVTGILFKQERELYKEKEGELRQPEDMRELESVILLKVIDRNWMIHIEDMDRLQEDISLRSFGQHDPVTEYKKIGYGLFGKMLEDIQEETLYRLYHFRVI